MQKKKYYFLFIHIIWNISLRLNKCKDFSKDIGGGHTSCINWIRPRNLFKPTIQTRRLEQSKSTCCQN